MENLLSVANLKVVFSTPDGPATALSDVSFSLRKREILGLVGESGCGKTVTVSAIMGLLPPTATVSGHITFEGKPVDYTKADVLRSLRGQKISMVFQDPATSLNPVLTVGTQLTETILCHSKITKPAAVAKARELLGLTGINAPETRLNQYPHQLSGGMRQRIMLAIALAGNPQVLIADEPTTALDVTVQAQIIDLLRELNDRLATSIILITHDLGIVAALCNRVIVMYAGQIVEEAQVDDLYYSPRHPYTHSLLKSLPRLDSPAARLPFIAGSPPDPLLTITGCPFLPRCRFRLNICRQQPPWQTVTASHHCRCWLSHPQSPYSVNQLFSEDDRP